MLFSNPFRDVCIFCIAIFSVIAAIQRAAAGVITFSDQTAGDNFMQTAPYDSSTLNGLPTGVTLTFSAANGGPGFESYNGSPTITDHTHLVTPSDLSNEFIFGDFSPATLTFNMPVNIVDLFIDRNTSLGASNSRSLTKAQPTVTGYLNQVQVFSFTNTAAANTWVSVTGGTVDTLVFSAFQNNMVDDIDVELPSSPAPEPSTALLLSISLFYLASRRPGIREI